MKAKPTKRINIAPLFRTPEPPRYNMCHPRPQRSKKNPCAKSMPLEKVSIDGFDVIVDSLGHALDECARVAW